ncbi:hypothetical protein TNCV_2798161 [Trichonephila clavipes]|nr:hypothetical protein TNCV_2798161 [Trichonephila clavipes]
MMDLMSCLRTVRPTSRNNKKRCAAVPSETGIHFRRKTDFFPEEDTTKSYSGFEPEPTRLQAEGHSHHTGWATGLHIGILILQKLYISQLLEPIFSVAQYRRYTNHSS